MKRSFIAASIFLINSMAINEKAFSSGFSKTVDSSFYGKKWYVTMIHLPVGNDLPSFKTDTLTGKTTFIIFNNMKKSAGGSGGCNSFGGTLSIKGDHIRISQLISTQMYCEGIQQIENDFFSALTKVNRFEVKNKKLLLYQDKLLLLELESE
jgi:hypothetical protein